MEYTPIERASDAFQQPVSLDSIKEMCVRAFGSRIHIESVRELGGGGFNNVYVITLRGNKRVVLRVSPRQNSHINSYEQTLMHNEQRMQPYFAPIAHLMPKTLMVDFTHQIIDRDYLFQTFMEGEQWASIQNQLTEDEKHVLWGQLGAITKQIHSVKGNTFASSCSCSQPYSWSDIVIVKLKQCVKDVETYNLDAISIKDIIEIAQTHKAFLDAVTQPRLLHGDLWTVNILLKRRKSGPRIVAVLDSDRGSWGDPMADWTMFLLKWHKPKGVEAFWEHYGQVEQGLAPDFRQLVYQGFHIGNALVEGHRLGRKDTLERGYKDIKNTLTQLQAIVG